MQTNNVMWKIGGEAGMGIKAAGSLMTKAFTRSGLYVFGDSEYPSLIRGGHNNFTLRVSDAPIGGFDPEVDILVALNKETIDLNKGLVKSGGLVVFDSSSSETIDPASYTTDFPDVTFVDVKFTDIVKSLSGPPILRNVVALGASLAFMGAKPDQLEALLAEQFAHKGEKLIALNVEALEKGFAAAEASGATHQSEIVPREREPHMVISGNEALAMGALRGGLKMYCAYPMTPSTSILHFLAEQEHNYHLVVKQTEDEISAINMAIGAAHTGARSMVATSGGGFSLMVEALGLAAITETPLVVVLGQRPGPATGLPTWTGQADLRFALHAAQDEFLRVIIAPGDSADCFFGAAHALQLAETYHLPVIMITDKHIAETMVALPLFDEAKVRVTREGFAGDDQLRAEKGKYMRYETSSESGVTLRSIPGQPGGVHLANSDEHSPYGFAEESSENRVAQMDKRWRKVNALLGHLPEPTVYGDNDVDITLISWGSTKGVCMQAMNDLETQGVRVRYIHVMYVYPFPKVFFESLALDASRTIIVENNKTGQFAGLMRQETGFHTELHLNKYDGRQFYPREIVQFVMNNVSSHAKT
jgi:2-oxoglutarate/2-oxoacid ferredoxin oxidoreductase subunit alpha